MIKQYSIAIDFSDNDYYTSIYSKENVMDGMDIDRYSDVLAFYYLGEHLQNA